MLTSVQIYFVTTPTPNGQPQARVLATFDNAPGLSGMLPVREYPEHKGETPGDYKAGGVGVLLPVGTADGDGMDYYEITVSPVKLTLPLKRG